jgi:hypothetical protein
MTNQQDWDAAATEAGYLPTSEYVRRWETARAAFDAAQEANRQAMIALEEATTAYYAAVNQFMTRVWK